MDKKYTIIGFLFLGLAFFIMLWPHRQGQRQREKQAEEVQAVDSTEVPVEGVSPIKEEVQPPQRGKETGADEPLLIHAEAKMVSSVNPPEQIYVIENKFIRVDFTTYGGAVKQVALKQYPVFQNEPEPYRFNEGSELPALSISLVRANGIVEEYAPPYRLLSQESNRIEFSLELTPGVELLRSYELSGATQGAAPYIIDHTTRLINHTDSVFNIDHIFVSVGTAPPTEADAAGYYLNFGYYNGEDFDYINLKKFKGGSFWGFFKGDPVSEIRRSEKVVWASAKNQFFASILTPEEPGVGILAKPVSLPQKTDQKIVPEGITGSIEFDLQNVEPGSERVLKMHYYVGPKEYRRLSKLDQQQDLVMQFGIFGFIGKLLLYMLLGLNNMVNNYGVAIILMTVVIRLVLWPLTAKAAQSSKKMAKIQEPLKELREKYKNNPEKIQKETLKLFQQHKINPAAGCLPIVVQIPIFFALFQMLRSASELRFASFLWIRDLSLSDTVATVAGLPINPLPLVMGATMYYQMKMMPATIDSTQQKIFKLLPLVFTVICYTFSSGLVLYWTVSNCFTIFQQFITNRQKDAEVVAPISTTPRPLKGKTKLKKRTKK